MFFFFFLDWRHTKHLRRDAQRKIVMKKYRLIDFDSNFVSVSVCIFKGNEEMEDENIVIIVLFEWLF